MSSVVNVLFGALLTMTITIYDTCDGDMCFIHNIVEVEGSLYTSYIYYIHTIFVLLSTSVDDDDDDDKVENIEL